jgi:hypothetical protein
MSGRGLAVGDTRFTSIRRLALTRDNMALCPSETGRPAGVGCSGRQDAVWPFGLCGIARAIRHGTLTGIGEPMRHGLTGKLRLGVVVTMRERTNQMGIETLGLKIKPYELQVIISR